jgi:hypothetical protein
LVLSISIFAGCAGSSKYMKLAPAGTDYYPEDDKALVIFMRPSTLGYAIQSSVFDVTSGENKLVGIISAKKKLAYKTDPGEHLFMVVGESADFMKAKLEAGKTYYALVSPRMGVWKARFSLKPVHKEELSSEEFRNWVQACEYVENKESAYKWAEQNAANIQSKREKYLIKWNEKPESAKPTLYPEDGI